MKKHLAFLVAVLAVSQLLTSLLSVPAAPSPSVQEVATGLEAPWAMAFAPDGSIYLTERPGRVRLIKQGILQESPLIQIDVATIPGGESGLLGLTLDPDFTTNKQLYIYYTYTGAQGQLWNRVSRLTQTNGQLTDEHVLLDGIKGETIHDGGRLKIGPDDKLYITTGDARDATLPQNRSSLNGKILRINPDGSVPHDNPFPGSPVYSYGHRNPQGLAWDNEGRLVESEHGPSAHDEINLIKPGGNYGWPNVTGATENPSFTNPVLSTGSETWAPSGITFYSGSNIPEWAGRFFVATLAGRHLRILELDLAANRVVSSIPVLSGVYGRLRDAIEGPDGFLYVVTSNRDGRGSPGSGDDKILRITSASGLPGGTLELPGYLPGLAIGIAVAGALVLVNWGRMRRKLDGSSGPVGSTLVSVRMRGTLEYRRADLP